MATGSDVKTSLENFPIQILTKFINTYKGERETLTAFLTNCQNAIDLAAESQKGLLLKLIISKLEGKAQIACSNRIFDKFDDLKSFLKLNFGETKHYNHLLLDLQSCKQQANESVAQYALRIETCLTDLQSEIHNSDCLKKELPGRIAMTEDLALFTFSLGLKPSLSTIVRCRNPKTLNFAVSAAIEEEKIQNLSIRSIKPNICKYCNKSGHSEAECFRKTKHPLPSNKETTSIRNNSPPITCRYCKNVGHDISQCRKRRYNNMRYQNNSVGGQQSPERKQIQYHATMQVCDNDDSDINNLN